MKRLSSCLLLCSICSGATLRVPSGFSTIQDAIVASAEGDTILVAPGEYIITEPITFLGKAISLEAESGHGGAVTTMKSLFCFDAK